MKERIIQFGEGNFLRGFVDYFINELNEKAGFDTGVVVIQPLEGGMCDKLSAQGCEYTTVLRGIEDGKLVEEIKKNHAISRCINPYRDFEDFMALASNEDIRFVISNTTEAGIAFDPECKLGDKPCKSFPGKACQLLYERYKKLGDKGGLIFIACELIDFNGRQLKKCIKQYIELWGLGDEFSAWVDEKCTFASSLVDRIVTGFPRGEEDEWEKKLGYKDNMIVTAEYFHLWVIEGMNDKKDLLPLDKNGYHVIFTDDIVPYKTRKVRILNGAHTMSVLAARMMGFETVKEMVSDPVMNKYINKGIYDEVIPTIEGLTKEELESFASSVTERFENPYIKHRLLDIALNSTSKFKERVLPSLLGYEKKFNALPKILTFALSALIMFYRGDEVRDTPEAAEFMKNASVREILSNEKMWGEDLTKISGLEDAITSYISDCEKRGIKTVCAELVK